MFAGQKGSALIPLILMASCIALGALSVAELIRQRLIESKRFEQKSDAIDLKHSLEALLGNTSVCACQLNPALTVDDSNDPNLQFDATATEGTQAMNLGRIRAGCDALSPDIVHEGQQLSSGLKVGEVRLDNLRSDGAPLNWVGDLTVTFTADSYYNKPITISQRVTLDALNSASHVTGCIGSAVPSQLACVTGRIREDEVHFQVVSSIGASVTDPNEVLDIVHFPYKPERYWGLRCRYPWAVTGCGGKNLLLNMDPDTGDFDPPDIWRLENGCFSDDEERWEHPPKAYVYATCCHIFQ